MFDVPRTAKIIPAREWTINVPPGCYCTTVMALHYYQLQRLIQSLNGEDCSPAMICDFSITPGDFSKDEGHPWLTTRDFFNNEARVKKTRSKQKKTNQEETKQGDEKPKEDTPPPVE